jgi:thiamine biosynthesis lipoprotein
MIRISLLSVCCMLLCASFTPLNHPAGSDPKVFQYGYEQVMGTSFDLSIWSRSEEQADLAEQRALEEVDRWQSILSSYDVRSEFSRWASTIGVPVKVSPELFDVLARYDAWRAETAGVLNPGAAAVIELWRRAEATGLVPGDDELSAAAARAGRQHWTLDPLTGTATRYSDIPLVMNSFVKSYILQRVSEAVMKVGGVTGARVNIGGDIMSAGYTPDPVRIMDPSGADNATPLATIEGSGLAVATSGDYKRGFIVGGQRYSHIVDPRSGRPAEGIAGVTVAARDAATAGALATAFNVVSASERARLLAMHPGTEYLLVTSSGDRIQSPGWEGLTKHTGSIEVAPAYNYPTIQGSWEKGASVNIRFELKRFESRARRPFVAVWVEDKDGKLVKTLALWFNKPRWVPDLKAWYRKHGQTEYKEPTDIHSLGSATRAAGAYSLQWDGKNDAGELVDAGDYTIHVEAVREHGGYELLQQKLTCKKKAQKKEIKGSVELESASFEYAKK